MVTDGERPQDATPFPRSVGERLRAAREATGLSLDEVAARTRVPLRHLEAMEAGDYAGLPSPTYAVGFARAYARAVGVDEVGIARDVRAEASKTPRRVPEYEPYVTADPTRIPSRTLVIVTAGVALAILVLAALFFGTLLLRRHEAAPPLPAATARPVPPAARPAAAAGQVTLTALGDVWVRVADAADKTLKLGVMKEGETYTLPAGADHPRLTVGRPDKLRVAYNGAAVPPLGDGDRPLKNVAIDPEAVAARLAHPDPAASPPSAP
jgi:cytoskeleton protein RodZ